MRFRLNFSGLILLGFFGFSFPALSSTPQVECYKKGTTVSNLTQADALVLCNSAPNTGPADCYKMVTTQNIIPIALAKTLCINASSVQPAQCYREITMSEPGISREQAVELCKARPAVQGIFTPITNN